MTDVDEKPSSEPRKRLPTVRTIPALISRVVADKDQTRHLALLMRTAIWPVVAISAIGASVLVVLVLNPLSTVSALTGLGVVGGTFAWRRRRSS
ncbi:hypothetical protein [Amycolatopsis sp. NPDC051102]|uniref:hypothetical protein n=1 Tax=Amycolatopsis sp. NPDC051102 TaxID=3155163 RepID=UPI0034330B1E